MKTVPPKLTDGVPTSPLTEGETFALEWSEFIPPELTPGRADQVVKFVEEKGVDDPVTIGVLKYIANLVSATPIPPGPVEQKMFRMAHAKLRRICYQKQGFSYLIAGYTLAGAYIPELDVPCKSFATVKSYIQFHPYVQTVAEYVPESAEDFGRAEGGSLPLLTRLDGLKMIVWQL